MGCVWAFDTETYLISSRDKAPKPVCCSWYNGTQPGLLYSPNAPQNAQLWYDQENHIVGHNIAYDLALMMRWHPSLIPAIVAAVEQGRVWDTQIREQLLHLQNIGGKGFPIRISLAKLEHKYMDIDRSSQKKGDDIWRLKYGTLDGIPIEQWPEEAQQYAVEDAVNTWMVFAHQGGPQGALPTESLQVQAALSLHLASVWGMKVNQHNVAEIRQCLVVQRDALQAELDAFRVQVNGKTTGIIGKGTAPALYQVVCQGWRDLHMAELQAFCEKHGMGVDHTLLTQALGTDYRKYDLHLWVNQYKRLEFQGMPAWCYDSTQWNPPQLLKKLANQLSPVPRSTKGPKTGEEEIAPILPYVPILAKRTEFKHLEKMLSTYVTPYEGRETVHPTFNTVVTTGRTSCEKPNTQNIPRGEGFRKNVHARDGYLYGTVDYSALEMVTLSATIKRRYGQSALGDAINKDMDLHCMTASGLFDRPYEEIEGSKKEKPYKDWRQGSKALNFGLPGGLGPKAFQAYARATYGVSWELDETKKRIKKWKDTWAEVKRYLMDNGNLTDNSDGREAPAVNNLGRIKNACIFTQLCNYPFQSLAADGVKRAAWELTMHQLLGWLWTEQCAAAAREAAAAHIPDALMQEQIRLYYNSPLRRSHTVNMIHDELVQEHPEDLAQEAFALQQQIMVDAMSLFTEGIKVSVEGMLGKEWEH